MHWRDHHSDESYPVKLRLLVSPARQTEKAPQATFEQAVLPHLDSAHNLARWLVRDASLAEDIVQDAILRALRHFSGFRGGDARAWLMQIVRNVAYSALASRKQRAETSLDSGAADAEGDSLVLNVLDPADDPEAALTRHQDLACLERQLSALPVALRECLVLRELEELSYKQIAEITGVPVGTVMSRLWRARQALIDGQVEGLEK
jgi:RNA polymerase sigma-70 factor (ECF subfamily)